MTLLQVGDWTFFCPQTGVWTTITETWIHTTSPAGECRTNVTKEVAEETGRHMRALCRKERKR